MDHSAFLDGPMDHSAFLDAPMAPQSPLPSFWQKAMSNSVPGGGGWTDPLGAMARLGGAGNKVYQDLAGKIAEHSGRAAAESEQEGNKNIEIPLPKFLGGSVSANALPGVLGATALGTASEANPFLPQNRFGAALTALPYAAKAIKGIGEVPSMLKAALGKASEAEPEVEKAGEEIVQSVAPSFKKPGVVPQVAGQVIKVASGVPEKYGTAAINDLGLLSRAKSPQEMSQAYQEFEKAHDITGLQGFMEKNWKDFSANELKDMAIGAAKKIEGNEPIDKQELYLASQAARKIRDLAQTGNPDAIAALNGKLIGKAKDLIDPALEAAAPGYSQLLKDNFESKAAQEFSNWLPKNKNLSPNVLRPTMALGAAVAGHPAALLGVSPKAWGTAIKTVNALTTPGENAATLARMGAVPAANLAGDEQPQPISTLAPQSPNLISQILKSNVLNPGKSGQWGKEIQGINLPTSMVNKSGKASISDIAKLLHERGAINENDEGEAVAYLKSLAGKVK